VRWKVCLDINLNEFLTAKKAGHSCFLGMFDLKILRGGGATYEAKIK
jgi:hypothetical protein